MAGLHYGAGIDTSQWDKDVEKMRKSILSFSSDTLGTLNKRLKEIFSGDSIDPSAIESAVNGIKKGWQDLGGVGKAEFDKLDKLLADVMDKQMELSQNAPKDPLSLGVMQYDLKQASERLTEYVDNVNKSKQDIVRFRVDLEKSIKSNFFKDSGEVMIAELKLARDKAQKVYKDMVSQRDEAYKKMQKLPIGSAKDALSNEIAKIDKDIQKSKIRMQEYGKAYDDVQLQGQALYTRINQLRVSMQQLDTTTEQGAKRYVELSKELTDVQIKIRQFNQQTTIASRGGAGIQSLVGGFRTFSGVMTTGVGLISLFNDETENMQKTMKNLQSVMSVSIGIEQLSNTLRKDGALLTSIYVLQIRAKAAADRMATKETIAATAAQKVFNSVAKANPYVLLATAIISLIGVMVLLSKRNREAIDVQKEYNKVLIDGLGNVAKQQVEVNSLRSTIEDHTKALTDRNKAASELQAMYPSIFGNLTREQILNGNVADSYDKVSDAILRQAKAKAAQETINKLTEGTIKRQLELEDKIAGLNVRIGEALARSNDAAILTAGALRGDRDKAIEEYNSLEKDLQEHVEKIQRIVNDGSKKIDEAQEGSKAWYDAQISSIRAAMDVQKKGSEAYEENLSLLQKLEKERDKLYPKEKKQEKERTKTFKQELDERKKLWEDYYAAVAILGRESANKAFGTDIDTDSSFVKELQDQKKALEDLDDPTQKQVQNLVELNNLLSKLTNSESPFEKRKNEIEEQANAIESLSERIEFLRVEQTKLGTSFEDLELFNALQKNIDRQLLARKNMLDKLLKAQKTYDEKVRDINEKYQEFLDDQNISEADKTKLRLQREKELMDAYFESLRNNPEFAKAFSDMGAVATFQLERLRALLIERLKNIKNDADRIKIGEFIGRIDKTLEGRDKDVIPRFGKAIKDLGDDSLETEQKLVSLQKEFDKLNNLIASGKSIVNDLRNSFDVLGVSLDSGFGDAIDHISDTLDGLGEASEGAATALAGIASGNPVSIITGSVKAVSGLVKAVGNWFNADKKKERQIKQMQEEVRKLQSAYIDLQRSTENALGNDVYAERIKMVGNLRAQQAKLMDMALKEESKKKSDKSRIADLQEQYKELNRTIEDIQKDIANDLLGTNVKSFSDNLSDALVSAFEKGEDAADSLNETINGMFQNIVKQAVSNKIQQSIQPIMDNVLRSMGFDPRTGQFSMGNMPKALTQSQINTFRGQLERAAKMAKSIIENVSDIYDVQPKGDVKPDTLSGAIQGMSQQTADILAGQFNAIRMDTSEMAKIMSRNEKIFRDLLSVMYAIKGDTANLVQMRKDLSDLNSKVSGNDLRSSGL